MQTTPVTAKEADGQNDPADDSAHRCGVGRRGRNVRARRRRPLDLKACTSSLFCKTSPMLGGALLLAKCAAHSYDRTRIRSQPEVSEEESAPATPKVMMRSNKFLSAMSSCHRFLAPFRSAFAESMPVWVIHLRHTFSECCWLVLVSRSLCLPGLIHIVSTTPSCCVCPI